MRNCNAKIYATMRRDGIFEGDRLSSFVPELKNREFSSVYVAVVQQFPGSPNVDLIRGVASLVKKESYSDSSGESSRLRIERIYHVAAGKWEYGGILEDRVPLADLEQKLKDISLKLLDEVKRL